MTSRTAVGDANDYRVVVLGSGGVGKTSLLTRFIHNSFKDGYSPTVEDTYRRVVTLDSTVCTLHITDTGGSHYFPAMKNLAISRGHAFLLVYAVNNRKSFDQLTVFNNEILSVKETLKMTPYMIVGNKCDLKEREVAEREGLALAKQWNCSYIETSARQDFQTMKLFEELLFLEKRHSMSLETGPMKKKKSSTIHSNRRESGRGHGKADSRTGRVKHKCDIM